MHFLEHNHLFNNSQHGFRTRRSCLTNLLELIEIVLLHVHEGRPIDVIFLDIQNAFDKVTNMRSLEIAKHMELQGKYLYR